MVTLSRMSATITLMRPVGSGAKQDLISWEAASGFVRQMASGLDQRLLAEFGHVPNFGLLKMVKLIAQQLMSPIRQYVY